MDTKDLQPSVFELRPGRTEIINVLYDKLSAVLYEDRFEDLPIAAVVGVLEMLKHKVLLETH